MHNIGKKRYQNIIEHFNEYGINLREHKALNKVQIRNNVLTNCDIQNVVNFIRAYASKVGILLPGRLPQFRKFDKVVKLPSSDTKSVIFREFKEAASDDGNIRVVSRTSFLEFGMIFALK